MNYSYETRFSAGIWNGIKRSFKQGSALTRLLYINIGIYLVLALLNACSWIAGIPGMEQEFLQYLGVPADLFWLARAPWTLVSYMFTHFSFLHLLFNMLWLYWFGSIFQDHLPGKGLIALYLLGGVTGAFVYMLAYNVLPVFAGELLLSRAIGASGAVMAIVFAVCLYLPNYRIYVLLIGPVRLIHLALFTVIVDLISIPQGNAGGHIAHLGGALFGCLYSFAIRREVDITRWLTVLFHLLGKRPRRKSKMRVKYRKKVSEMSDREYNMERKRRDDRVNEVLDKISRSGYDSLTKEERAILFNSGR
ncbi:MAG: rhomboid family intramembrane serine protease [Odoribacteraceae bacterium]|jgi:membrane associated rhomboid family serine protease|nr:rhomboid family intramembrane serine protease [Odoribacteraceae bacterium]